MKRILACVLLLALLLSAAGCTAAGTGAAPSGDAPHTVVSEPPLTAKPAAVLGGVETESRVVSLIFEGYTDDATMKALADILEEREVPATFFVSGITANENTDIVRMLALKGFAVESYGMSGGKHLDELSARENLRRFSAAQREIALACGRAPELVRCNGTTYTEDVLRAVTAAGLKAAVQPTAYLNHRSFQTQEEAELYALGVLRGSILSVKLGQELDEDEYGEVREKLEMRPAIDPTPGIRWEQSDEDLRYVQLPQLIAWLLDALQNLGYSFTDPVELQKEAGTLLPKLRTLDEEEQKLLDPMSYIFPVTKEPLTAGEVRVAGPGDFSGAVFVGDEVLQDLASYVDWRREEDPTFLDDARFLAEKQLTVEQLLDGETEIGDLAARLKETEATSVWLCLGYTSRSAFRRQAHLAKYRLLIKQIREQNPDIRVVLMPVLPKVDRYPGVSNENRFALDLMLCGMCREYGLAFSDAASAVRDEYGQLREDYCLDLATRGSRLNDAGCEAVVDFIRENYPL